MVYSVFIIVIVCRERFENVILFFLLMILKDKNKVKLDKWRINNYGLVGIV